MKIGVIGSGVVAQTLGGGFLNTGTRSRWARATRRSSRTGRRRIRGAEVKSFADAAAFGDVVVLAVAGAAALDALSWPAPRPSPARR